MLQPRIYRAGFVAVALATVIAAFSLVAQQAPLTSTLAPDAFNGQNAFALTRALATADPVRPPGGPGDEDVASSVANRLRLLRAYRVSTDLFTGRTATGTRTLENVVATRPGLVGGTILILSHRDAAGTPGLAELSGTGTMLELAGALAGESTQHTIVLASTSASAGAAGAAQLARSLPGPIDAVVALGDTVSERPRGLVVVPWSGGANVAPTRLRTTVAAALAGQAGLRPGGTNLFAQLVHLALPISLGEQAPFGARGIPSVTISLSGDRPAGEGREPSAARAQGTGRALLSAIDALDAGPELPAAQPYLLFSGKVVPDWALRLLVLALLFPVLPTAVDGFARARRRGHGAERAMLRTVLAGVPFLIAFGAVIAARIFGVLHAAPPGPVSGGAVHFDAAGAGVLVAAGLIIVGGTIVWAKAGGTGPRRRADREPDPGSGVGSLLVLWAATFALWVLNPFAALLVVPALHLWMWLLDGELRPRPLLAGGLVLAGLALPVLAAVEYAHTLGLGPGTLAWNAVLLVAGGAVPTAVAVLWCVLLGCLAAVAYVAAATARAPRPESAPVTVRGPITYAGPGSLGGTKSALRR